MNTRNKVTQATRRQLVTFSAVGSLALSSALLVACGGGGGVGGAGTGSVNFSAGAVTGKGSTIVNGVRFDDSGVNVIEDANDDSASRTNHVSDDVTFGMEVEIEHGAVTCPTAGKTVANCDVTPVATATKMSYGGSSVLGVISGAPITLAGVTTFTVFGQTVVTNKATVINLNGNAVLADAQVVEVHGSYDAASKTITATRIEIKAVTLNALGATVDLRMRGTLVIATGTPAPTTATVGDAPVSLLLLSTADVTALQALNGQVVRIKVDQPATPNATPKVKSFKSGVRKLDNHKGASAELEGAVEGLKTDATSGDLTFTLGGAVVRIKASALANLRPVPADLANGVRVEVEGSVDATSGELVAAKLKFKKAEEDTTGLAMEVHGYVETLISGKKTIDVRHDGIHVIVAYDPANWPSSKSIKSANDLDKNTFANKATRVEIKAQSVGGVITLSSIELDK